MTKSPMALVMFLTFPAVAFIMTNLIDIDVEGFPNPNLFVTMMAAIFAGMGLITAVSDAIAEDIERKCLRFLVIAGVKPHQYLLGTGGFYLCAGTVTAVIFAIIGDFTVQETLKFLAIMIAGVAASILLGAAIGIYSKNRQTATALSMPAAVLVGFTPMIANFNETVERFAGVLYTQQINVIVNDFSVSLWRPLLVVAGNIAVLTVLFIVAYNKSLKKQSARRGEA
jgi:ABC-2 type transport system permease protein